MKKTNKGFSLVELIIVIAIMAILAGALAPALIKYINKSRASAAVSNGQQIASAIQTALSNESVFDCTSDFTASNYSAWVNGTDELAKEVKRTLGGNGTHKCKKTLAGSPLTDSENGYIVKVKTQPTGTDNMVEVYVGKDNADYMVYPTMGKEWKD